MTTGTTNTSTVSSKAWKTMQSQIQSLTKKAREAQSQPKPKAG
jgi:hypothetical protein